MAMSEEFSTEYLKYFNIEKRVNVNISFDDGCFFNEWGEVRSFRGRDQIEIVFSSDLPSEGVRLGIGTTLELRAIIDETRYSCHGIVVESDLPRFFTIRLIGDVIMDDPREFYRINAFLPLTYRVEPVGNPRNAEAEWPSQPTPIAANISGGGLRSWFPEKLEKDRLVELLLYIPLPNSGTRSIPVVGKVVHVRPEPLGTPTRPLWDTAIHFQKIDEHDRDEIIRFISLEQRHHSSIRERFFLGEPDNGKANARHRLVNKLLYTLILLLFCILTFNYLAGYYRYHEPSEIGKILEKGVREYLQKLGR
jgi:hypothetical protein